MKDSLIKYIDKKNAEELYKPIRNKIDLIKNLLKIIQILLLNNIGECEKKGDFKIILKKDKMSRVICSTDNKIYSYCFPFHATIKNNCISNIYLKEPKINIDNKVISLLNSFFYSKLFDDYWGILDYYSQLIDDYDEKDKEQDYWMLIRQLINFESGYLRYDFDEVHFKKDFHPLHHLDFFYSSNTTFKIGLCEKWDDNKFIDLIDINQKCCFIKK